MNPGPLASEFTGAKERLSPTWNLDLSADANRTGK
jgi:hypothetical protein